MMYMEDAIRATIELTEASLANVKIRSSYNLAGISFDPSSIGTSIKKIVPEFELNFKPDYREEIAASWPESIDDSAAQLDWGWAPKYDLKAMTEDMLTNLRTKLQLS